ncbi:MAG: ComEA family DNA-binding protein [Phycisphaeraceae bacterium]|nr:ComEA family DNA-binding protein [Phycisphaeraceae bacterium]MCW5763263.1 ComEA family DNA-binding protein [Phycisphaeraceae bacterium]
MTSLNSTHSSTMVLCKYIACFVAGLAVMGSAWALVGSRSPAPAPAYQVPLPPVLASRSPAPIPDAPPQQPPAQQQIATPVEQPVSPQQSAPPIQATTTPAPEIPEQLPPPIGSSPVPLRINVNTATQRELELLPGIGPALSQRIIEERMRGRFRTLSDLDRVRGIGPRTLERLEDLIVFE